MHTVTLILKLMFMLQIFYVLSTAIPNMYTETNLCILRKQTNLYAAYPIFYGVLVVLMSFLVYSFSSVIVFIQGFMFYLAYYVANLLATIVTHQILVVSALADWFSKLAMPCITSRPWKEKFFGEFFRLKEFKLYGEHLNSVILYFRQ